MICISSQEKQDEPAQRIKGVRAFGNGEITKLRYLVGAIPSRQSYLSMFVIPCSELGRNHSSNLMGRLFYQKKSHQYLPAV